MQVIIKGSKKYFLYALHGRVTTAQSAITLCLIKYFADSPPTQICSYNKKQQLSYFVHITDHKDVTHPLHLDQIDFHCMEGDLVTLIWIVEESGKRGPAMALRNNTTGQSYFNKKIISTIFLTDWRIFFALALACFGLVFYCAGRLSAFVSLAPLLYIFSEIRQILAFKKASSFEQNYTFPVPISSSLPSRKQV